MCVEGGAPLGYLKGVEEGRGLLDIQGAPPSTHRHLSDIMKGALQREH